MQPLRQMVEVPRERIRHGLRLVVVIETGEVTPAPVATDLDQARAELDAEDEPADEPDEREWRRGPRGSQKNGEEAGLEEQRLPTEGVKGLPDVDDREVERPEHRPEQHRERDRPRVRQPDERRRRKRHAAPRDGGEETIRVTEVE